MTGIDVLIFCVFTYWLVKHAPELAADAIREIRAAITDDVPPDSDRMRRLAEDGYDTADGGAFRRFTGNVWRDFWNDQRRARNARRAGTSAPARKGAFGRLVDAWDDEVERRAQKWARRETPKPGSGTTPPSGSRRKPGSTPSPSKPGPASGRPDPATEPHSGNNEPPPFTASTVHNRDNTPPGPRPGSRPTQTPQPEPARDPIRVDALVGDPIDEQPTAQPLPLPLAAPFAGAEPQTTPGTTSTAVLDQPEGTDMTATVATRGIPVTGIQSGANECRAINVALDLAVAEFQQRLDDITSRVHAMGEATLGLVQFAGNSDVVTRMAQAAEAAAAAKGAAKAFGTEVGPLLEQTRREFLRRA